MTVEPMTREHWPEVERIYAEGIATGHATFEAEPPSWEQFDAGKLPGHRLVAVEGGRVAGWAAASPVSDRCVYAGVAEHSVYVAAAAAGRGVGRRLLEAPRGVDRGRRHLDPAVRGVPGERREPRPARLGRVPGGRDP